MKILLIIAALFVTACSSTQGLSVYSLTSMELTSALSHQIPALSKRISVIGLPVQFDVNDVSVNIGPDSRDVVALNFDSSAEINAFTVKYPVRLKMQIEGTPFYDSEKKAIFVRNIKLLDSSINAAGFRGSLAALDSRALNVINAFLSTTPVYTLNLNDPKIALISRLPLDIKVVEGAITLIPRV